MVGRQARLCDDLAAGHKMLWISPGGASLDPTGPEPLYADHDHLRHAREHVLQWPLRRRGRGRQQILRAEARSRPELPPPPLGPLQGDARGLSRPARMARLAALHDRDAATRERAAEVADAARDEPDRHARELPPARPRLSRRPSRGGERGLRSLDTGIVNGPPQLG